MNVKIFLLIFAVALGFSVTYPFNNLMFASVVGAVFGAVAVGVLWGLEPQIEGLPIKAILGGAAGVVIASFGFLAFKEMVGGVGVSPRFAPYLYIISFLSLYYLAVSVGIKKGLEFDESDRDSTRGGGYRTTKILDTSVIIDGRIADVAEAGFIEGALIVPKFIIKELQYIADSPELIKRARGRRGLDILKRMQSIPNIVVKITNHDFPRVRETDLKLVELAGKIKGTIITNDFNLNKVAGLQGVKVLNLNQLSSAIKPVVLPGETMNIKVIKEGKEGNQGVGYLEDGTMVVVDDARRYLGREVEVAVTSVLQTPTGRMIFSKVKDEALSSGLATG
ncbi:MAG: PIN/TRAM domain-containing protein [Deltaproteobacteria bacterium]